MLRTISIAIAMLSTVAATQAVAEPMQYPDTRKAVQTDDYHGTAVADPYRWLEDDNSAETKAWVKAQNDVSDAFFAKIPQRQGIRKIYTELYNYEKFGIPRKEGKRYFWTRNDGLQQQSVVYTAVSLAETPKVALDPNTLSADGTVALSGTAPSRDGRYLAYGVAVAGSDWQEWRVRDLRTGKDLADTVKWVKFSNAAWTPDSKGFFYARYDAPGAGTALTGSNYFQKLYYHRIGESQDSDVLIFQNKIEKEWGFGASVSDDGKFAIIYVRKGTGRKNGLLWMPLKDGALVAGVPKIITLDFEAEYVPIASSGGTLWIRTDKDAPRGKIMAINLARAERANWKTVVPEAKDTLTSASGVGGKLFAQYLTDAASNIKVYAADGKFVRDVALPGVGTAGGFAGR